MMYKKTLILVANLLLAVVASNAWAEDSLVVPKHVHTVITSRCLDCHSGDDAEGDVRLDSLANLALDARLDLLNQVQEQLHFNKMPPEDAEQPSTAERAQLVDWVAGELRQHQASKLEEKLRQPEYGNHVDHDKLFSGDYADRQAFTYDRRWLISDFIFDAKLNRILNHEFNCTVDGQRLHLIGTNRRSVSLTNPFLLPTGSGVRYYANETLSGGHLLTMMANAKAVSANLVEQAKLERSRQNGAETPGIDAIMGPRWEHEELLASRERFLKNQVDQLLRDMYGDENDALLPDVVRVKLEGVRVPGVAESDESPAGNFKVLSREDMAPSMKASSGIRSVLTRTRG